MAVTVSLFVMGIRTVMLADSFSTARPHFIRVIVNVRLEVEPISPRCFRRRRARE